MTPRTQLRRVPPAFLLALIALLVDASWSTSAARAERTRRHRQKKTATHVDIAPNQPPKQEVVSKTVFVEPFTGPNSNTLRANALAVLRAPKRRLTVIDASDASIEISETTSAEVLVRASRQHQIHAFIRGSTVRSKKSTQLVIEVRDGRRGEVIHKAVMTAKRPSSLKRKLKHKLWKELQPAIADAEMASGDVPMRNTRVGAAAGIEGIPALDTDTVTPPPGYTPSDPQPAPEASATNAPVEPAVEPEPTTAAPERIQDRAPEPPPSPVVQHALRNKVLLDAELGAMLFSRSMSYQNDISGNLRPYDLGLTPAIAGALDLYPGAFFTDGIWTRFGLTGSFARAPSITSTDANDVEYNTLSYEYFFGGIYRQPLGPVDLLGSVEYGSQWFKFEPSGTNIADIPAVRYRSIRAGLGIRLELARSVAVTGGFAYLPVLSSGGLEEYFPNIEGAAIEGNLGAAVKLGYGLELRASLGLRRYSMDIHPEPGDTYAARGMTDQYTFGVFSIAYRWERGAARIPWIR